MSVLERVDCSGNLKKTWNVINSSLGRKPKMTVIYELVYEGKDFVQKQDGTKCPS